MLLLGRIKIFLLCILITVDQKKSNGNFLRIMTTQVEAMETNTGKNERRFSLLSAVIKIMSNSVFSEQGQKSKAFQR